MIRKLQIHEMTSDWTFCYNQWVFLEPGTFLVQKMKINEIHVFT